MNRFGMQRKVVFLLLGLVCTLQAQAGRPLTVDDANVNDAGEGHVEGWWTRAPNGSRSWTVAPAYAPIQNVELGAGIAREQKTGLETLNVQAKSGSPNHSKTAAISVLCWALPAPPGSRPWAM